MQRASDNGKDPIESTPTESIKKLLSEVFPGSSPGIPARSSSHLSQAAYLVYKPDGIAFCPDQTSPLSHCAQAYLDAPASSLPSRSLCVDAPASAPITVSHAPHSISDSPCFGISCPHAPTQGNTQTVSCIVRSVQSNP